MMPAHQQVRHAISWSEPVLATVLTPSRYFEILSPKGTGKLFPLCTTQQLATLPILRNRATKAHRRIILRTMVGSSERGARMLGSKVPSLSLRLSFGASEVSGRGVVVCIGSG